MNNLKIILSISIVLCVSLFIYFSFHIPLGSFEYQDKKLQIKIELSGNYEGYSFGNAITTINYKINFKDKEFNGQFDTERIFLSITFLKRNREEIILLHDEGQFEDYAKCGVNECKEFGLEYPSNSWRFDRDTLILDTGEKIFGDTIAEIYFDENKFIKRK